MMSVEVEALAWQKMNGLIPAIVQDASSKQVLMLGYMDKEALQQTLDTKRVTFYSRTKAALWIKGQSSGHFLELHDIASDCDKDALIISAKPAGPTCHLGSVSCFKLSQKKHHDVIAALEQTIAKRQKEKPNDSYVAALFAAGTATIAQKVGEEGVEVALAAMAEPVNRLCEEVADLLFHVLVLLSEKNCTFADVLSILAARSLKGS